MNLLSDLGRDLLAGRPRKSARTPHERGGFPQARQEMSLQADRVLLRQAPVGAQGEHLEMTAVRDVVGEHGEFPLPFYDVEHAAFPGPTGAAPTPHHGTKLSAEVTRQATWLKVG